MRQNKIMKYPQKFYKLNYEIVEFIKIRVLSTYKTDLSNEVHYSKILKDLYNSTIIFKTYNIEIIEGLLLAIREHNVRDLISNLHERLRKETNG